MMGDMQEAKTQPNRRHRLALSGSAGVGKTTLARTLAARWSLPYVDEGMRRRLEAGLSLHSLDRDQQRALLCELADEAHAGSTLAVTSAGGFVSDRSPIDQVAFWLHYGFGQDPEETTCTFITTQLERAKLFDLVVLLPWGVLPFECDGRSSSNTWLQLKYQALVEGLLRQFLPSTQLAVMPKTLTELEDRIEWIEARLEQEPSIQATQH